MSADKKSNQSQIAQATLDEPNQSVKVTIVANEATGTAGDVNVQSLNGNIIATGAGNVSAGTQRVVIASNQPTIPVDIQDTEIAVSLDYTEDSITIHAPNGNTTPIPVSGSVNVSQVGGNNIATGGGNITTGTQRVTLAYDQPPLAVTGSFSATVTSDAALDVLGTTVTGARNNQIEVAFDTAPGSTLITNTVSGGASVTHTNGHALYSTGVGLTASAKGVSVQNTQYRPAHEVYSFFTAAFTTPTSANSRQRLGLFNATNGFFIGYEGLTFGITKRTNGVDTFIPASSFNSDLLNGVNPSKFTRNGVVEAINLTTSNLFRIRFAWLGSANILFEVLTPDAKWVTFHNIRQPNSDVNPSIYSPDLPMTVEVSKTAADATSLTVYTACWAAGTTSELDNLTATLNDNSLAALTRSVITGQTSAGGGGYVNVKVTPSGSLTTAIGDITGIVGQSTMANSVPVVIASNQSAVPVSQSGTWNIGSVASLPSIPAGNNNIGDVDVVSVPAPLNIVGSGVGTSALRVQLADESLSALENITVTVSNEVEVKNDAGNPVPVSGTVSATQSGTWNINNVSGIVSLPTGASTAAKQDSQITELQAIKGHVDQVEAKLDTLITQTDGVEASLSSIDGKIVTTVNGIKVDGSAVTQPVSGTVTANAGTGNFTVVQASAANLNATVTGTVAATQSGTWNINNVSGTVSLPTNAATETTLSAINTKTPALGSAVSASSSPVVIASDQVVPVTFIVKQTYAAGITNLNGTGALLATAPTDIATITGSATKVVKVRKVHISGVATSGAQIDVFLIKRSTANTGGTAVTVTNVPYDSLNAAATATVRYYGAAAAPTNPTVGTAVGTISQSMLFLSPLTSSNNNPVVGGNSVDIEFKDGDKQPLTLRGVNEVLAINLNGITVPAGTNLEIDWEWTEE